MKRLIVSLVILTGITLEAQQFNRQSIPVMSADEVLTVSTTSVGFTVSVYKSNTDNPARYASCSVETNQITVRISGGAATASVRHVLDVGSTFEVWGTSNLDKFRMIRTGGADATVKCSYGQ